MRSSCFCPLSSASCHYDQGASTCTFQNFHEFRHKSASQRQCPNQPDSIVPMLTRHWTTLWTCVLVRERVNPSITLAEVVNPYPFRVQITWSLFSRESIQFRQCVWRRPILSKRSSCCRKHLDRFWFNTISNCRVSSTFLESACAQGKESITSMEQPSYYPNRRVWSE